MELVFPDQLTWLTSLCDYVSARDDLQLVIRIHPRMGAVKGANAAPLLEEYKKAFASLPAHCTVLWPESPVSSYDLAELADLALISWSTMGRELFRIGVPVLGCAKNFYYVDDDFIHVPEDAPSYFAELDAMLRQTYTLDTLRRAIRYQTMLTFGPTINLAPGIPNVSVVTPEDEPVIPRVDDENLSKLYQLLTVQDDIFSMNMQHTLCDNKNNLTSEKQEEEAIVAGIGHYIESLFCPFQNPEDDIFQLMKEFKQKDGTIAIPRATAPRLQKILDLAKQAKLNSVRPGWAKRKLRCSSDFARLPMYLGSGLIN